MSVICSDLLNQNTAVACESYAHLRELELADSSINSVKSVDLLIGLDFYYSFITGESIRGKANEPIAIKSTLGWVICGTFENSNGVLTNLNVTHMYRIDQTEISEVKTYETDNSLFSDFNYKEKEKQNKYELK